MSGPDFNPGPVSAFAVLLVIGVVVLAAVALACWLIAVLAGALA